MSGLNFVDYCIILVLVLYGIEGMSAGFLASIADLLSFVISFSSGLTFYSFFGRILVNNFSIPSGFANAIGFFITAFLTEIFVSIVLRRFIQTLAPIKRIKVLKILDGLLGGFAAVLSGILLASFILTMAIALPLSPFVKHLVSNSRIAKVLTSNTQDLARGISNVFGGAVNESLTFLTVEPKGNEIVNLNLKTSDFKIDEQAERDMFNMINNERTSRGIRALSIGSQTLINVARAHCQDMLRRGYFSHYTPEGLSPFDRMENAGVSFRTAGENLALAPNIDLAMKGLMQSPGHKANILSSDFGRVGVGAIDAGVYGEMFCQEFTD